MANTYVKLGSITVGPEGTTSMQFTNIPQNFTDLVVKISARGMSYWLNDMRIRFNNSNTAGTEYDSRWIVNNYGSVASNNYLNTMGINLYYPVPGQSYIMSESTFGNFELYISNYSGNTYKTLSGDWTGENGDSSYWNYMYQGVIAGTWKNTAAITSINLDAAIAWPSFRTSVFSTATLYGISSS